jgi:hypothetical protein
MSAILNLEMVDHGTGKERGMADMGRGGAFIFGIGRRHGVRNGLVSESGPLAELLGKRATGAASGVLKAEILVDLEEGLLAMEGPDQGRFFRVGT